MTAPTRGVFQGKTYGFADEYGAKQFASQPEKYVRACTRRCFACRSWCGSPTSARRRRPDPDVAKLAAGMSVASPTELGTQTDTHRWSVTSIRTTSGTSGRCGDGRCTRPTISKATHGSQTHSSHFRRENTTQVWLPKRNETQTVVTKDDDTEEEVHRRMRGAPDVKLNVVNGVDLQTDETRQTAPKSKICDGSLHLRRRSPRRNPTFLFFQC